MPAQTVIDSLEFARTGQMLGGALPIAGMTRLKDSLFDTEGDVRFELRGTRDARLRPALVVEITGLLRLRCQRCLGTMAYPLHVSNLLLLGSEETGDFDAEDAEWIEASRELDVSGLVEEEIILSLPYSPRHEHGCAQDAVPAGQPASSAFSRLAELKRRTH